MVRRATRPGVPQMPGVERPILPKIGPVKDCSAHGCPLAGTFTEEIYGNHSRWWCFIHSNFREYDYQSLTHAIRSRQDLLDAYAAAHVSHDKPAFLLARANIINTVLAAMRPREPGADDQ